MNNLPCIVIAKIIDFNSEELIIISPNHHQSEQIQWEIYYCCESIWQNINLKVSDMVKWINLSEGECIKASVTLEEMRSAIVSVNNQ